VPAGSSGGGGSGGGEFYHPNLLIANPNKPNVLNNGPSFELPNYKLQSHNPKL